MASPNFPYGKGEKCEHCPLSEEAKTVLGAMAAQLCKDPSTLLVPDQGEIAQVSALADSDENRCYMYIRRHLRSYHLGVDD